MIKKADILDVTLRYIKPLNGLIVRDPITKGCIPDVGMIVPWVGPQGRFWRRRLKDRSIEALTYKPSDDVSKAEIAEEKTEKITGGKK